MVNTYQQGLDQLCWEKQGWLVLGSHSSLWCGYGRIPKSRPARDRREGMAGTAVYPWPGMLPLQAKKKYLQSKILCRITSVSPPGWAFDTSYINLELLQANLYFVGNFPLGLLFNHVLPSTRGRYSAAVEVSRKGNFWCHLCFGRVYKYNFYSLYFLEFSKYFVRFQCLSQARISLLTLTLPNMGINNSHLHIWRNKVWYSNSKI